jgi:hypothetical protein
MEHRWPFLTTVLLQERSHTSVLRGSGGDGVTGVRRSFIRCLLLLQGAVDIVLLEAVVVLAVISGDATNHAGGPASSTILQIRVASNGRRCCYIGYRAKLQMLLGGAEAMLTVLLISSIVFVNRR